jgi:hypothetical protein
MISLDFLTDDHRWNNVAVTTDGRILDDEGEEVALSDIEKAMETATERIEKLKRMIEAATE